MKRFTRVELVEVQQYDRRFMVTSTMKRFRTDDGLEHEFTNDRMTDSHAVLMAYDKLLKLKEGRE